MTDKPDAPTEKLQPPPPPPAQPPVPEAKKPSAWDRFRTDPVKPLIAGAVLGLFGFGALAFTAGYWVGQADRGDSRVIERFQGPGMGGGMNGPMQFRHQFGTPPDLQNPPVTSTPSPSTSTPS